MDVNLSPSPPHYSITPSLSLTGSEWRLREADERQVAALMQRHGLPELLARVLAARGIAGEQVPDFLSPSLKASLPDPSHLRDMDAAAERLAAAIVGGERIAVFGDYDVDGATSSALLARFFGALGAAPMVYIPDRMKEGYGPNAPALLKLKEQGAAVVVTVDCGTLAFEPLAAARAAGLDVIVVDHHQGEARRPECLALVNPNRLDEDSPHGQLAAVGVAFLLCVAVNRALRRAGFFSARPEPDLRQWLDIVALGTVCDVVPLTGANRALVAQGLKVMAARGNTGIRTVMDTAGIDEKPGTYSCGFIVGPRINAGGRVGRAGLGARLLATDDEAEALAIAKELEQYNAERKAIEAQVLEQAMAQAEAADPQSPLLLLAGKGWHAGVIGIVAGRVKDKYHVPTAVVALEGGTGKASARSVSGVDFGAAVIAALEAGLLEAGGGHAMAAGFTVREEKLAALAEFLAQRIGAQMHGRPRQRVISIDGALALSGATPELVEMLDAVGPFGQGNPALRMVVRGVVNLKPDIAAGQHVKTLLSDPLSGARLSAISFRSVGTKLGDALLATRGRRIDAVGQLRLREWNGTRSVSLMIEDIADAA